MSLVNTAVSKGRKLTREILQSDKGADRKGSSQKREKFCISLFSLRGLMLHTKSTIVSKSGPPTKTTISTVSRGPLRSCNQTKGNLPLAFQFVYSPTPPGPQTNWKASGR